MVNVSVIYYSATGTNSSMATAVAEGVRQCGGMVRVRLVEETAPPEVIEQNPRWKSFVEKTAVDPRASLDDVKWADAVIFGTPTRFGNVSSQLKAFIDTLGELWFEGALFNKVYSGFTSAQNMHGGQEATLLSLYTSFYHFGGIIVTPGYTDKIVFEAGGNPYGPSVTMGHGPTEQDLAHARYLGMRVTEMAGKIKGN